MKMRILIWTREQALACAYLHILIEYMYQQIEWSIIEEKHKSKKKKKQKYLNSSEREPDESK